MANTPGAGDGYAYLEAIYQDAQEHLETTIRAAALNANAWTENRARLQLAEVRRIAADLHAQSASLAQTSVQVAHEAAINAVSYHAASIGVPGAATALSAGVNTEAVELLATALTTNLEDAASTLGRQAQDAFRRVGLHHTAVGLATGETRRAISNHMVQDFVTQGISGFVDAAGRRWSLSAYTSMVARTTTREAVSLATKERMGRLGMDLVTISEHGETDEVCAEYAGNTYSLSGDTSGYEQLPDEPPFHPNCVHVMTPADANEESFLESLEGGVPEGWEVNVAEQPSTPVDVLSSGLPAAAQRQRLRELRSS